MAQLNYFTFNGHSAADYGLLVTGRRIFNAPARRVERYSVAGRNGDVLIEMGSFDNIIIQYDVAVTSNFATNATAIKNWLQSSNGYMRLTDTYDTTHYRMAAMYQSIEFTMTALNREGQATIEFDCKPQRFLLTGESTTTFNSSGSISNPSQMAAKPLLRVYGTGNVTVAGTTFTVNSVNTYVDVDCETQQCYKGSTNCNNNVTVNEFPTIPSGSQTITLGTGITKVIVTPRWWEL